MAFNAEIADRVLKVLEGREGLTERKMFGGIAFMLNGNMSCGVTNDDLMVRVAPTVSNTLWTSPTPALWILPGAR